jgi:hypothetical protein
MRLARVESPEKSRMICRAGTYEDVPVGTESGGKKTSRWFSSKKNGQAKISPLMRQILQKSFR